jgi:hypothetical protein
MLVTNDQNACQNRDTKISNSSPENVAHIKYLATTITNQNLIREESKRRLNCNNASYHSVQNHVFSSVSKNVKFIVLKTTALPVVLYGSET